MKYVQSVTFRALSALCIGSLLIAFPDKTTTWLVIIVGILFLIPGLISIVAYFNVHTSDESMRPLFPIVGIGSVLFGIILIVFSGVFMDYMKYVLAAFLLLAGISQLVTLINLRKWTSVGAFFYIISGLIALTGIFVLIAAQSIATCVLTVLGTGSIVYGIAELISAIRFRNVRRIIALANKKAVKEASPTEDETVATTEGGVDSEKENVEKPVTDNSEEDADGIHIDFSENEATKNE
jgi:uncharacterized membrane protein HdeD (DUF308 family)